MRPSKVLALSFCFIFALFLVLDSDSAKGENKGHVVQSSSSKELSDVAHFDKDEQPSVDNRDHPTLNKPDMPPEFPDKLKDRILESRKKTNISFGGVLACICENKVLFTNLVCMPCSGEEILKSSITQL